MRRTSIAASMKAASSVTFARVMALALAFPGSLFLTQCNTNGKSVSVGRYTQATLRTPTGHGMERKDYPFDTSGRYRVDWVKNNARGMDPSAHGRPSTAQGGQYTSGIEIASSSRGETAADTPPQTAASAPAPGSASVGNEAGFDAYPGFGESSSPAPPVIASEPTPQPAPAPAPRYHRVVSGDTLYSLSRRYGTSVDSLKRVNALRGDTIHVGQSLRIP